jgi:hypothetical protein
VHTLREDEAGQPNWAGGWRRNGRGLPGLPSLSCRPLKPPSHLLRHPPPHPHHQPPAIRSPDPNPALPHPNPAHLPPCPARPPPYARSKNALTGTLGPGLGQGWPLMEKLGLNTNQLRGPIPPSFAAMGRLKSLYL